MSASYASRAIGVFAAVVVLLGARGARATPTFPAEVATHLGLGTTPDCIICHQSDAGGTGTVTKPFGIYLRSRGLVAFNLTSLDQSLDALVGESKSNAEYAAWLTALRSGEDPNTATGASSVEPAFGCGAQIGRPRAPGGEGPLPAIGGIVFAASLVACARIRRRRAAATHVPRTCSRGG
jgi:hypothetical protein